METRGRRWCRPWSLLDRNGYRLAATEEELYDLLLEVASHGLQDPTGKAIQDSDAETLYIAEWLIGQLRTVQKQERSRKWNKFRQLLNGYGCDVDVLPGNKMNIVRTVGGVPLRTQVAYRSEGTEVEINTVKKVRRNLELDEEHGYPSDIFYRQDTKIPGFVNKYGSSHKCVHDSAPAGRPRRGKRVRMRSCQLTSGEVVCRSVDGRLRGPRF